MSSASNTAESFNVKPRPASKNRSCAERISSNPLQAPSSSAKTASASYRGHQGVEVTLLEEHHGPPADLFRPIRIHITSPVVEIVRPS